MQIRYDLKSSQETHALLLFLLKQGDFLTSANSASESFITWDNFVNKTLFEDNRKILDSLKFR